MFCRFSCPRPCLQTSMSDTAISSSSAWSVTSEPTSRGALSRDAHDVWREESVSAQRALCTHPNPLPYSPSSPSSRFSLYYTDAPFVAAVHGWNHWSRLTRPNQTHHHQSEAPPSGEEREQQAKDVRSVVTFFAAAAIQTDPLIRLIIGRAPTQGRQAGSIEGEIGAGGRG